MTAGAELPVQVVPVPGGCVVRLEGDVDVAVASALESDIRRRVGAPDGVVLDLTAVSFLDSAGIRLVDSLVGHYERQGVTVRVVAPPGGSARFALEISVFRPDLLADDVPPALAALSP
ncbi:hypothetical protein Val02_26560 [Virgisporangium aliadipatigenens]|uniref:STAS domain-containing protein n=1 Tax=Virgisporangium aliadipatigenens TaxID=741659 RepID=A0A8J3YKQ9_9ACTN|nr:STAS domain-containing protein [Virgisporangium aliadipatigenens]GIJ45770.1 hypothetical protein Val02_26560 [Virgisporangium aliadipatigenens]